VLLGGGWAIFIASSTPVSIIYDVPLSYSSLSQDLSLKVEPAPKIKLTALTRCSVFVLYCTVIVPSYILYIAPEITEDSFEDLLAYDDVLLDYFNAFLCLPVSS